MTSPIINLQEEFTAKIPALAILSKIGYTLIPPHQCEGLRGNTGNKSTAQVMLLSIMRQFLQKQTFPFAGKEHHYSQAAIDKILLELQPAMNEGLKGANEKLYHAMLYGVGITEFIDGKKASPTAYIIDWHNISNNAFHCTEEMHIQNSEGTGQRIPDIICFVNGLPLAIIEAKRPAASKDNKSTIKEAISQQIRNQGRSEIPHLFAYSQVLLAINGHKGLYGTCGTPEKFWAIWKEEEISEAEFIRLKNAPLNNVQLQAIFNHRPNTAKNEYLSLIAVGNLAVTDQDRILISILRPDRLLEMTRLYTLFDERHGKIIARYQQIFSIKALIKRLSTFHEHGLRPKARKGGVIWHTTGSGKSFSMVFLSKAILWLNELYNCRVIVVTDRVDLETQISKTFFAAGALSRRDKSDAMATTGQHLAEQISKGRSRIIFSIINKFNSAVKYKSCYNDSPDIIVLVDEGHRSQNGENNIRMMQSLPRAAFIAFTGTPLLKDNKTENKFGKIIHSYTMQQAVKDKTVTPLLYEERIPDLNVNSKAIDAWFERITLELTEPQKNDLKKKFSQKGQIYQTDGRIELIAYDISDHFQNFKHQHLKGQLACDSRASAIRYKLALDAIGLVTSALTMSAPDTREGHDEVDAEKDMVQAWWKANVGNKDEKTYTKEMIKAFSQDNGPDIMIVVDKLLTGFDEPKNTVLYIDKPLKEHNLIQAIARVNRLHNNKRFGYLIDYRGILKELDTTIEQYQNLAERTQGGYDIDDLKGLYSRMDTEYKKLPTLHKTLWAIFDSVQNKQDFVALRQVLSPKILEIKGQFTDTNLKKRDDFYTALTAFSNCMKIALQSATYFYDKSFDSTRNNYKQSLKMFLDLRKQVREDANETIDYDSYTAEITQLLNKHIAGIEIKEPDGIYSVHDLGKKMNPEDLSDDEARNQTDKITGRITKMISQDLADDPYAQEYFSELLKRAIAETRAMFNAPIKQYILFVDFKQDVKNRKVAGMPSIFNSENGKQNKNAQAYFGLFKYIFKVELLNKAELDDAKLTKYAFEIDAVITKAMAEYSINPAEIDKTISRELLPMLFTDLGIENTNKYIQEVLNITNLHISRTYN